MMPGVSPDVVAKRARATRHTLERIAQMLTDSRGEAAEVSSRAVAAKRHPRYQASHDTAPRSGAGAARLYPQ